MAAGLAYGLATSITLGNPIYAVVSAVIVTDVDSAQTRKLALPRVLGTAIGAGVGCVAAVLISAHPLTVAVGVLVPMFLCRLLGAPAAAKVAGYVSGITIVGFASNPWLHARDRLVETLVGIAAAALVSMVPILFRTPKKETPAP